MAKIPDKLNLQLKRLTHASAAFKRVIAMCKYMQKHDLAAEPEWYPTAVCGVCTEYMRPFMEGNGIGSLPKKRYEAFDTEEHEKTHCDIKLGRNWVFAHNDAINAPTLVPDDQTGTAAMVSVRALGENKFQCSIRGVRFDHDRLAAIVELCDVQISRVTADMSKVLTEIVGTKKYTPGVYTLGIDFP